MKSIVLQFKDLVKMSEYHSAQYYKNLKKGQVLCQLCPQSCRLSEGSTGLCQVRKNIQGELYSLNYGQITSLAVDPIEKKPLYHFYPGSEVLSLGSWGCNLSCVYCQNWQISQQQSNFNYYSPQSIIKFAQQRQLKFIAYTYSEPIVFYEYMLETAKLAQQNGIKNILISNGLINQEPLKELVPYLAAANIDLKSFRASTYQKYFKGDLVTIKDTIAYLAEKVELEISALLVSDLNTDMLEVTKMVNWLSKIDEEIPLHLNRYFPAYQLKNPATKIEFLRKAYQVAKERLKNVYLGNAIVAGTADTYCSFCSKKLISRHSYQIESLLQDNCCPDCAKIIYGRFKANN